MTGDRPRRKPSLTRVSASEAARLAGVQARTLSEHVAMGAPAPPPTRAAIAEWLPRYHDWLKQRRRGPSQERVTSSSGDADETKWRTERSKWLAMRAKMSVLREFNTLVSRKDVEDRTVRQVLMVKQRLTAMCKKMAGRLMGAVSPDWIEEQLLAEVAEMCNAFARGVAPDDEHSDAAAQEDAGLDRPRESSMGMAGPADGE